MIGEYLAKKFLVVMNESAKPLLNPLWVKVIRSTEYELVRYFVVADFGDGPNGYFYFSEKEVAERMADALRKNEVHHMFTLS